MRTALLGSTVFVTSILYIPVLGLLNYRESVLLQAGADQWLSFGQAFWLLCWPHPGPNAMDLWSWAWQ